MSKRVLMMALIGFSLLFVSNISYTQGESEAAAEASLDAYQAIAETYYEEGVDENYMLQEPENFDHMWFYYNPDLIKPGMIAPDFELMAMDGEIYKLSDFRGEKFVVIVTGSWY